MLFRSRAENGTRWLRLPLDPWRSRGTTLTIVYPKLGNNSFLRIARALAVVWPLIWTANVLAYDCQKLAVEGHDGSSGRETVSEQHVHAAGHIHSQDHDHEKPGSNGKGTGSCCCDKLTPAAAVILHKGFVPSDSRTQAQPPDLTLQCAFQFHFLLCSWRIPTASHHQVELLFSLFTFGCWFSRSPATGGKSTYFRRAAQAQRIEKP